MRSRAPWLIYLVALLAWPLLTLLVVWLSRVLPSSQPAPGLQRVVITSAFRLSASSLLILAPWALAWFGYGVPVLLHRASALLVGLLLGSLTWLQIAIPELVRAHGQLGESGALDPAAGDLAVTGDWGHVGRAGATMPGKGLMVERSYADAELADFREGIADLGLTFEELLGCLGETCLDVYLNDRAYWRCLPKRVWTYTIGGYQVMKKWLSYRERPLLGRDLRVEEARYVTEMARRIAAILLLEPALDANYERVKADTYEWPSVASPG